MNVYPVTTTVLSESNKIYKTYRTIFWSELNQVFLPPKRLLTLHNNVMSTVDFRTIIRLCYCNRDMAVGFSYSRKRYLNI